TGTTHLDLKGLHAVFLRLLGSIFSSDLRRIRGRLAAPLETHDARGGPRNRVALHVGDGDHGVVERGIRGGSVRSDILAFLALDARRGRLSHLTPLNDISAAVSKMAPAATSKTPVPGFLLLLAGDCLCRALAGAGIGVGTLATNGQA